jgi:hypothetical protein
VVPERDILLTDHGKGEAMSAVPRERIEEDLSVHIFSVSAAMVGVCLTVIGIMRIVIAVKSINTLADDLLAVDALLFLGACLLAYLELRTRSTRRMRLAERGADALFISALVLMAIVCGIVAYAIL